LFHLIFLFHHLSLSSSPFLAFYDLPFHMFLCFFSFSFLRFSSSFPPLWTSKACYRDRLPFYLSFIFLQDTTSTLVDEYTELGYNVIKGN
jgi:hypothetical protein